MHDSAAHIVAEVLLARTSNPFTARGARGVRAPKVFFHTAAFKPPLFPRVGGGCSLDTRPGIASEQCRSA